MKKSYSKIRHTQETNMLLENRFLSEKKDRMFEQVQTGSTPMNSGTTQTNTQQQTGNTPTLTFKVVTNNWGELPKTFNANLVSKGASGGLYFGRFGMANSAQLNEYYKKNINTLTDDGYICYTKNNTMYLIGIKIDNGQIGANDCTVERGNAADITKSPEYDSYTKLPSGSTEYMIVKKPYDENYSFLGVLKGGTPCWNYLYNSMSSKYPNMSKCWTS